MLSYLIAAICINTGSIYNNACNYALNATTIQINIKRDYYLLQDNFQKIVETELYERVNKQALVTTLGIYQIYTTQTIVFNFPIKSMIGSISGILSNNSSVVNLSWNF